MGGIQKHIRAIVTDYGRRGILAGAMPIKFASAEGIPTKIGGRVIARDPDLVFRDGARLKLYEKIQVIEGQIRRLKYSYHYQRPNGYFFRYEREETVDPVRKPEYHLHVVLNLPHFNASPIDLESVLQLIVANFYSPEVYSRQIIGQEINLTV